ncbi:hypothetical protein PAECIP111891_03655 [Paenibacillus allorhizoplanae]|uniref:WIAG-tail domain n=1 Tax=Paenibacillus allorhizoplanae TaxID=2905648 RepID=A0ABN8GK23_9BACL|nr:hypothetical protein [Paenibacillus allorhizoplanae]CAH1211007.1 hypothetical protein PAECIP111891_03655 [Paenibacillus allorhizoplanae]
MSQEQELGQAHEKQTNLPQQDTAPSSVSPVIAWEQPLAKTSDSSKSKVISIESYRRQDAASIDSEATVTVREFPSFQNEEPIRLIMVSSGFGQKTTVHTHTIQCKAA